GTKGIHLPVQDRINRASPVNAVQNLPTYLSAPSQATLDSLPYTLAYLKTHTGDGTACGSSNCGSYSQAYLANGFASNMTAFMPWGSSNYNGLQVQLQRNFTNGLQFQLSYTWSHALDNSTADVFSTWLTPRRPQDFGCVSCDYSTSALNRAQRLTFAATYDAPWFKNDNWVKKNLLGNWQISPVFTYQSPEYATVNSGGTGYDSNLNRDTAGDRSIINYAGVAGTSSDVTPLTNSNGAVVAYQANTPTAYYIAAGAGAYATAQRNTMPINPIDNLDLSILKRLNITERQNLEFQAQFLNLFNHAQYLPGYISDVAPIGYTGSNVLQYLSPGSPSFNTANQVFTNHPRQLVLVVKYNF
ncbi:MAG: carboxypeptidase regulatory-like domain-containing protein, partial [Acidobacteriota bacterium]|nr:carboxypeptidase regulatory-like domain-containing protein [Acidobacteriota bacterium]